MDIREQWIEHLGLEDPRFPRDLGLPYGVDPEDSRKELPFRVNIKDEEEFFEHIEANLDITNIYVALYSDNSIRHNEYDKSYFDVDVGVKEDGGYIKSLKIATKRMRRLVDYFEEAHDYTPRVYFSGCKGFAIYIDYNPITVDPDVLRFFGLIVADRAKATVDTSVLGDRRRVSRPPFTLNFNNLVVGKKVKSCVPIDPRWKLKRILRESKKCTFSKGVEIEKCKLSKEFRRISKLLEKRKKREREVTFDPKKAKEQIDMLVMTANKIKDGRHRLLAFIIVPSLISSGWGDESIHFFCHCFIEETGRDYRHYRRYVEQSIERTKAGPNGDYSKPWRPWSFDTLLYKYPDLLGQFGGE